jgi:hypothetical protein
MPKLEPLSPLRGLLFLRFSKKQLPSPPPEKVKELPELRKYYQRV